MSTAPITLIRTHDDRTAGLIWEEPPTRQSTSKYDAIAAALKAKPGQWAIFKTYPAEQKSRAWGWVTRIHSGKTAAFPRGKFEARSATVGDEARVYVRFIGEQVQA